MIIPVLTFTEKNAGEVYSGRPTLDADIFAIIIQCTNTQDITILYETGEQKTIEKMTEQEHEMIFNMSTRQALNFLNNTCCDGVLFNIHKGKLILVKNPFTTLSLN